MPRVRLCPEQETALAQTGGALFEATDNHDGLSDAMGRDPALCECTTMR